MNVLKRKKGMREVQQVILLNLHLCTVYTPLCVPTVAPETALSIITHNQVNVQGRDP